MKGGVSAIHSLHCSFGWHLHSVPLHLIWSLTVRSLPLAASRNSQLSCLPHIWLAYNYAHSILHCIKMMSSWLPANLFKSAPAQRSRGEEEGGGDGGNGGGGRGEWAEAMGWGAGNPTPHPSSCPACPPPQDGGIQGCLGAIYAHLGSCGSAGVSFPPRAAWTVCCRVSHSRRPGFFSVGIYERYLHLVGSTACLPSNRLLPLPRETGWKRGAAG